MSQNFWATIMPFGPVTLNFLLAPIFFSGPAKKKKKGWSSFQTLHAWQFHSPDMTSSDLCIYK